MTDLDKLIETVEAGFPDYALLEYDGFCDTFKQDFRDAYHGSLDAAKSLHEALLPGWKVLWDSDCMVREVYGSRVTTSEWTCYGSRDDVYDGFSEVPARAWLLAILKAYRSQQETE